jgi:hypothetical protein
LLPVVTFDGFEYFKSLHFMLSIIVITGLPEPREDHASEYEFECVESNGLE